MNRMNRNINYSWAPHAIFKELKKAFLMYVFDVEFDRTDQSTEI